MTTSTQSLEQKIENAVAELVREHLLACESAAAAAMKAGFRRAASLAPALAPRPAPKSARRTRTISRRRAADEIADLEEQLYAAIVAHPGETMTVLAPVIGASAKDLNRPALVLRRKGRVRSVGARQSTRYFPMGE